MGNVGISLPPGHPETASAIAADVRSADPSSSGNLPDKISHRGRSIEITCNVTPKGVDGKRVQHISKLNPIVVHFIHTLRSRELMR